MEPFLSIEGIWQLTAAVLELAEKVVWLENPARGRIKGLHFRGFVTRTEVSDVTFSVCPVKLKPLGSQRSCNLTVSALRCSKQATSSPSCTDWVWPPGGAAILGKPCWILWVHRGQRPETCVGKLPRPGNLFKFIKTPRTPAYLLESPFFFWGSRNLAPHYSDCQM